MRSRMGYDDAAENLSNDGRPVSLDHGTAGGFLYGTVSRLTKRRSLWSLLPNKLEKDVGSHTFPATSPALSPAKRAILRMLQDVNGHGFITLVRTRQSGRERRKYGAERVSQTVQVGSGKIYTGRASTQMSRSRSNVRG
jgi:hypothetical protein